MDRQLSAWRCAVTMDAADIFITWQLIRRTADTDSVSAWFKSAWTDCARQASCALLSWWPITISAVLNSGSAPAGRIFPARFRWESMSRDRSKYWRHVVWSSAFRRSFRWSRVNAELQTLRLSFFNSLSEVSRAVAQNSDEHCIRN